MKKFLFLPSASLRRPPSGSAAVWTGTRGVQEIQEGGGPGSTSLWRCSVAPQRPARGARCRRAAGAPHAGLCSRASLSRSDSPCCPASVRLPPQAPLCRLALPGVPGGSAQGPTEQPGNASPHGACCCRWCFRLGHPSGIIITWLGAQVLMWLP